MIVKKKLKEYIYSFYKNKAVKKIAKKNKIKKKEEEVGAKRPKWLYSENTKIVVTRLVIALAEWLFVSIPPI